MMINFIHSYSENKHCFLSKLETVRNNIRRVKISWDFWVTGILKQFWNGFVNIRSFGIAWDFWGGGIETVWNSSG